MVGLGIFGVFGELVDVVINLCDVGDVVIRFVSFGGDYGNIRQVVMFVGLLCGFLSVEHWDVRELFVNFFISLINDVNREFFRGFLFWFCLRLLNRRYRFLLRLWLINSRHRLLCWLSLINNRYRLWLRLNSRRGLWL